MRTKDAVTSIPNISITFGVMTVVYLLLGISAAWLLSKHIIAMPVTDTRDRVEVLA